MAVGWGSEVAKGWLVGGWGVDPLAWILVCGDGHGRRREWNEIVVWEGMRWIGNGTQLGARTPDEGLVNCGGKRSPEVRESA